MKTDDASGPGEGYGQLKLDQQAHDIGESWGKTALHKKVLDLTTTPHNSLNV